MKQVAARKTSITARRLLRNPKERVFPHDHIRRDRDAGQGDSAGSVTAVFPVPASARCLIPLSLHNCFLFKYQHFFSSGEIFFYTQIFATLRAAVTATEPTTNQNAELGNATAKESRGPRRWARRVM